MKGSKLGRVHMVSHYLNQELTINLPEATLRVIEHRAQRQNSSLSQYGLSLIVKGLMAEEYTDVTASGITDTRHRNRGR